MRTAHIAAWVAAALPLLACQKQAPPEAPVAPPGEAWLTTAQVADAKMEMEAVEERTVDTTVTTTGRITFDDLHVSHVFSPVTGRVVKIESQPGDRVKKGQPLAVIESPDLGVASSDVSKARADLLAAERDFKRQSALYEAHAGAQRDFEAAEDNYARAKAESERAHQKARLLVSGGETVSQQYTLRAPIDGEVIGRYVNPAMEVQGQYSGGGNPVELFTVGDLDSVWVLGDIFEMDLGRVQKEQGVQVTVVAYPTEKFDGKVDWVSSALDPATRTAKVRCTIQNPNLRLKPEMFATVVITSAGNKTLAVQRRSVFRLGGKTVVFVQQGAGPKGELRFERRPVQVDEDVSGDLLPVLSGVQVGDKVVVSGAILLAEMT